MRRSLPLLALACAIAACSKSPPASAPPAAVAPPAAPASTKKDQPGQASAVRLTVYSRDYESLRDAGNAGSGMPGYALVERPLHYALVAGPNAISATGVPASIDAEAALLQTRSAGVTVESQRYVAPVGGGSEVIARLIGQRIAVEHTSGGSKQTDTGILLAATDGFTLALGDGRVKVIRSYDSFSVVDGSRLVPTEAELKWTVQAAQAGDADFLLSYPMGGMAWRAEYRATLAEGAGCDLKLDGAALVANRSGVGFSDARLTLVADEPNLARASGPAYRPPPPIDGYRDMASSAGAPATRTSGEYHAYEIPGRLRLASGATERVPLFAPLPGIGCARVHMVDAGMTSWRPQQPLLQPDYPGATGPLPVTAVVTVANTSKSGLGRPLPAGRVRVFDGADFLGESALPHTPGGGDIKLQVGRSFDLSASREATGFRVDRAGRTATESFEIVLGNASAKDATIRVVEALPRWSQWEIVASSLPSHKKNAGSVEFDVPVPAGGEARLTYTVRYRWNAGVNP